MLTQQVRDFWQIETPELSWDERREAHLALNEYAQEIHALMHGGKSIGGYTSWFMACNADVILRSEDPARTKVLRQYVARTLTDMLGAMA